MARVNRPIALALAVLFLSFFSSGCCNTCFKMKQTADNIHSYFLDGDPELLSEAEPDNSI